MKKIIIYVSSVIFLLAVFFILGNTIIKNQNQFGSVERASEMHSTSTLATTQGIFLTSERNLAIATSGDDRWMHVLGSVIITSSSDQIFELHDATSTNDVSSTTILRIDENPALGTYTFDIILTRGLFMYMPTSFNGVYMVTYR